MTLKMIQIPVKPITVFLVGQDSYFA